MREHVVFAGWMVLSGLAVACGDDRTGPISIGVPDSFNGRSSNDVPPDKLRDPNTCGDCHQEHFKEWAGSMHAYASIDPVFRAMNARGQKETNGALGDFCVKCHAPMAVAQGLTTDGLNLESLDEKYQGVTCYFCHDVQDVAGDHDNPLVLANDAVMRGPIKAPLEFGHKGEYSPWLDDNVATADFKSSSFCGGCHDVVLPAHFSGAAADAGTSEGIPLEQTFHEWKSSVFAAAAVTPLNCTSGEGCHMKRVADVPIANPVMRQHPTIPTRKYRHEHDFPAVDTALVDFPEADAQLSSIEDKFSTAFRIQLCADPPGGSQGNVAVLLENLSAGHYLPSGASQDRRIWVELHAYRQGTEIFESGVVRPGVAATTVEGTWVLRDEAFKADGVTPAKMLWDVAKQSPNVIGVATTLAMNANQLSPKDPLGPARVPDRVTMTIWVEPIGLDVIDDLIASGYLDPGIRSRVQRFAVRLKGVAPAPTAEGTPVTFEWTLDAALAALHDHTGGQIGGEQCVEFPPPVNMTVNP